MSAFKRKWNERNKKMEKKYKHLGKERKGKKMKKKKVMERKGKKRKGKNTWAS